MCWYPQALFTAEHGLPQAYSFVLKNDKPIWKSTGSIVLIQINQTVSTIVQRFRTLTQHILEMRKHPKRRLYFARSFHIDPIGGRNDVQYL